MKYRKKPIVVDAWPVVELLSGFRRDFKFLPHEIVAAYERGVFIVLPHSILVETLEGQLRAKKDDFLVMGTKGEFYPIRPEIFAETYEPVD